MRGGGEGVNPGGPAPQEALIDPGGKQVSSLRRHRSRLVEYPRLGGCRQERHLRRRLPPPRAGRGSAPDSDGRLPGTMPGTPSITAAPPEPAPRYPMPSGSAVATPDSLSQPDHGTVHGETPAPALRIKLNGRVGRKSTDRDRLHSGLRRCKAGSQRRPDAVAIHASRAATTAPAAPYHRVARLSSSRRSAAVSGRVLGAVAAVGKRRGVLPSAPPR